MLLSSANSRHDASTQNLANSRPDASATDLAVKEKFHFQPKDEYTSTRIDDAKWAQAVLEENGVERKWTSESGKHHTVATIVKYEKGVVYLRKQDSEIAKLTLGKLSKDDQRVVKDWGKAFETKKRLLAVYGDATLDDFVESEKKWLRKKDEQDQRAAFEWDNL